MLLLNWFNLVALVCIGVNLWSYATPQNAAAYTYCVVGLANMALSTSIAWYRRPPYFHLPDIGHDILPNLTATLGGIRAHTICDNLLRVTVMSTLLFITFHNRRVVIMRRFCMVYGTIMFMRSFTLLMTALPDPYYVCATHTDVLHSWTSIPWRSVFNDVFELLGSNSARNSVTCGDLIFSGHTVLFVLCALVVHTYYKTMHSLNPLKLWMWIISVVGTTLLLITRMHWTLDIALAYYITITCWNFYHGVCRSLEYGHYIKSVVWVDGAVIYPFIAWVETGCTYNQYQSRNKTMRPGL